MQARGSRCCPFTERTARTIPGPLMRDWYRLLDGAVLHATDVVVQLEDPADFTAITLGEGPAGVPVVTAVDPATPLGER